MRENSFYDTEFGSIEPKKIFAASAIVTQENRFVCSAAGPFAAKLTKR